MTSGSVSLRWKPPVRPNGIISFYFITYSKLDDWEQLPVNNIDSCQFVNTYKEVVATTTTTTTTTTAATTNTKITKSSNGIDSDCQQFSMKTFRSRKTNPRLDDHEKNDIISIEDEIYNLAFRPAARKWLNRIDINKPRVARALRNAAQDFVQQELYHDFDPERVFQEQLYDMDENLMKLVKQDLFVKNNEVCNAKLFSKKIFICCR